MKRILALVLALIIVIALLVTGVLIFANNQIKEIDQYYKDGELVLAEEKIENVNFVTKFVFGNRIKSIEKEIKQAKKAAEEAKKAAEEAKKTAKKEYIDNCWLFLGECDAEEMYIRLSDAFDNNQEEAFGYWIQILGVDLFSGETRQWRQLKEDVGYRAEKYSEIKDIPDILKDDSDIKTLHSCIKEIREIYPSLYDLVTNPSMFMTRSEFMSEYNSKTEALKEKVDKTYDVIKEIRGN